MNKSQKIILTVNDLISECKLKKDRIVLPTSLHDVYWSSRLEEYEDVDLFVPDGMPLVWFLQTMYSNVERLYGPDIFTLFLKKFHDKKHIFMGSTDVLKMIQVQNSHLNAEFISLPFSEDVQCLVNESEMKTIVNFSPDFIWIGLSSPKQVRLASYIKKRLRMTSSSSIFCVGAAFDLYVGKQKSPSDLIKRVGLEWFFRLVHSPGRLWKRYMVYSVLGLTKLAIFVKKN